jgi:hypothetical protein
MTAYDDNPEARGDWVWVTADDSTDRRSRASQVTAHRRRYEKAHGVRLEFITKHYSETPGFLSRSAFRYRILRPKPAAPVRLHSTTIRPPRPSKPEPNARQRRTARRSGGAYGHYSLSMPPVTVP